MLEVPQSLYNQVADRKRAVEGSLRDESEAMGRYPDVHLRGFYITPETAEHPSGATRSGVGFPARQCPTRAECVRTMLHRIRWTDFCSDQSRRFIFTAPSRPANFRFAPLPASSRGWATPPSADFVIYRNQVLVLELDGKQFHPEPPRRQMRALPCSSARAHTSSTLALLSATLPKNAETIAKQIFALLEKLAATSNAMR